MSRASWLLIVTVFTFSACAPGERSMASASEPDAYQVQVVDEVGAVHALQSTVCLDATRGLAMDIFEPSSGARLALRADADGASLSVGDVQISLVRGLDGRPRLRGADTAGQVARLAAAPQVTALLRGVVPTLEEWVHELGADESSRCARGQVIMDDGGRPDDGGEEGGGGVEGGEVGGGIGGEDSGQDWHDRASAIFEGLGVVFDELGDILSAADHPLLGAIAEGISNVCGWIADKFDGDGDEGDGAHGGGSEGGDGGDGGDAGGDADEGGGNDAD